MASAILGSAAIVSTGFAAWVITVEDTKDATGNVQVDTVEDNSHILTITAVDANVYFGLPEASKQTIGDAWLTEKAGTAEHEDLIAQFTVEVTNFASATVTPTVKSTPTDFDQVRDGKRLLKDPAVNLSEFTAKSVGSTTGVATLTVTFSWGEYFGATSTNPYNFYNAHKATDLIKGSDTTDVTSSSSAISTVAPSSMAR